MPVGREDWGGVVAGGRCREAQRVGAEVVDGEEAVRRFPLFAAAADVGEEAAVGRKGQLRGGSAIDDEGLVGWRRRGVAGEDSAPDLAAVHPEQRVAVWGKERRVAVDGEVVLTPGGERDDADLGGHILLEVGRVGGLAVGAVLGTVGEGQHVRAGRPGDSGDVAAVVGGEASELAGCVAGAADEEVVAAFGVLHPGKAIAGGSCREVGRIRCAENLLEGEGRLRLHLERR
jgi:hypothetical protein